MNAWVFYADTIHRLVSLSYVYSSTVVAVKARTATPSRLWVISDNLLRLTITPLFVCDEQKHGG